MAGYEDITAWISGLKKADSRAAQVIWEEYFSRLVRVAGKRLKNAPRRDADEEDIALSAMKSFMKGAAQGKFPDLDDHDDLWKLLVTITGRKVIAQQRRRFAQKRGEGNVRGESIFVNEADDERGAGIGQVLGAEPTPEFALVIQETCEEMLAKLEDETLRLIALRRIEGFTVEEIATECGCTARTVERKLKRIRQIWSPADEA